MNLKEALSRAKKWNDKVLFNDVMCEISNEAQPNPSPIKCFEFIKDGKKLKHCFCPTCKKEWEMDIRNNPMKHECTNRVSTSDVYNASTTYTWNNRGLRADPGSYQSKEINYVVLDVDKAEGLIVFGKVSSIYDFVSDAVMSECIKEGNYDFLRGKWIPRPDGYFVFLAGYGFRKISCGKMNTASSSATMNLVRDVYTGRMSKKNAAEVVELMRAHNITLCDDGILKSLVREDARIQAHKKPAPRGKAERVKQAILTYDPEPIEAECIVQSCKVALFYTLDQVIEKTKSWLYCPVCGESSIVEYTGRHPQDTINSCPKCGTRLDTRCYGGDRKNSTSAVAYFNLTEDGYLVMRCFTVNSTIMADGGAVNEVKETKRTFFTPKKLYLTVASGYGEWHIERIDKVTTPAAVAQTPEEIRSLIEKSVVRYSGLIKAWGLDGSDTQWSVGDAQYFKAWLKNPFIETLLAAGLSDLARDFVTGRADARMVTHPKGKTPCEILGIPKPVFKIAREERLRLTEIQEVKQFYEMDNSFCADDWHEIKEELIPTNVLFDLKNLYSVPLRKSLEYLDGCYGYQCIAKQEAATLWRDYLHMATCMDYNLSDKSRKYPRSLKKEHDKATFAYRAVRAELEKKNFAERAEQSLWLEDEGENYIARIPREPEEMVTEGVEQNHCLASYVKYVSDGNTNIVFIRQKDEPDKPFFAMEVRDKKIIQVHGYCNHAPKEPALLEFIKNYARKKGLVLAY